MTIPLRLRLVRLTRYLASADRRQGVHRSAIVDFTRVKGARDGVLIVGENSLVSAHIAFDRAPSEVRIGPRTFIGTSKIIASEEVSIGADVLISWGATIVDHDSHSLDFDHRKSDVFDWQGGQKDWDNVARSPVRISDRVWIGFDAVVLKGVTIGEGAVVAARSVVTKDVPPWTLVAGNPAKEIRSLTPRLGPAGGLPQDDVNG